MELENSAMSEDELEEDGDTLAPLGVDTDVLEQVVRQNTRLNIQGNTKSRDNSLLQMRALHELGRTSQTSLKSDSYLREYCNLTTGISKVKF